MKQIFTLLCLLGTLAGCGASRKIDVANVRKLSLEYNPQVPLNYGKSFQATVIAHMNNGEEVDITSNKFLTIVSPNLSNDGTNFTIIGHPTDFNDANVISTLTITGKEETFTSQDTLTLNFMGPLSINLNGEHGSNGEDQKDRSKRLIGRNGKDGEHGGNGANGGNSEAYNAYIWKENNETRVRLIRPSDSVEYAYKTVNSNAVVLNISGGNGGNGGDGGDGSDGKDGEVKGSVTKGPGNGGNAGNGGNGGNGGNAGTANVMIHTNASVVVGEFVVLNNPGKAGTPGKAGVPGKAGKPLTGQTATTDGTVGVNGKPGTDGFAGSAPSIQVQNFDYSKYQ